MSFGKDESVTDVDYDAAFADALTGTPPSGDAPAAGPAAGEVIEPDADLAPAVSPAPAPEASPAPAPAAPPAPPVVDPMAAMAAQLKAMEQRLAEATKQPPAPAPPAQPAKPAALSAEDQETLDAVEEDWPTLNKAMQLRIQQLEAKILAAVDERVAKVDKMVAPMAATAAETAQEKFMAAVLAKHADATTLLPQVEQWIATLPQLMQKSYNAVLDYGSPADVAALYDAYKTLHAIPKAAPAPAAPATDPDKERRLAGMEGVRPARSGVSAEADPNDFDGAFEAAVRQSR
jgi:hypothetical protein